MTERIVSVDQLQVGVFIRLDLKWYEHPFLFSSFKISSPAQIRTLQRLGVTHVAYDPLRSQCDPLQEQRDLCGDMAEGPREACVREAPEIGEARQRRIRSYVARKKKFQKCEKEFHHTFVRVRSVMQRILAGSHEALEEAGHLVEGVVDSLLLEREVVINLMNIKSSDENVFYHTLNVAVLAMILGRELGLDSQELRELGLGALFHDIGKSCIPKKYLYKRGKLTPAELELVQRHPIYGEEIVRQIPGFPENAVKIIRQHHESVDGSGYPQGLRGESISLLAGITSLCDAYDNLCNPLDPENAMTPHEALSRLYREEHFRFPGKMVELFVRCVGVYPPGTIVELSSGQTAMVMSHNLRDTLRPAVLVYDRDVPAREAAVVSLEKESGLEIVRSIRASELSADAFNYLTPRSRLSYYFESGSNGSMAFPGRSGATR